MNGCQEYELLFSAQLDGELSPEETARLDRHLAQCPACRRLARELACIHTELEDMTAEPPADLTDRILAQLPPVSPPPVPAAPSELQAPRRTLSRLVCATAAALVLLGGASLALPHSSPAEQEAATAQDSAAGQEETAPESQTQDAPPQTSPAEKRDDPASIKQNPAEQTNPDPQPPSRSESDSETAEPPAENSGSSEGGGGSGGSAPLLTEQAAEDLLTQQFMQEGRHVQLLSLGLDTEETHWRFSVRTEDGRFLAVFSVSRTDGSIHKMPTN